MLAPVVGLLISALASAPSTLVPSLDWEIVSRRPHDSASFTQGLVIDDAGRLYESSGRYGQSSLREVDPSSGAVLRSRPLADTQFGEGLAAVDTDLVQLTWRAGAAVRYDAQTLEPTSTYAFEGQGWGLCFDGERLVMSDGSDHLTFRDAETFGVIGGVDVSLDGEPVHRLNELECVDGSVWANIWYSDTIVRIDPGSGQTTALLDLSGILEPHPSITDSGAVLNGIAYDDAADTYLVTGKLWPELIEIRLVDPET